MNLCVEVKSDLADADEKNIYLNSYFNSYLNSYLNIYFLTQYFLFYFNKQGSKASLFDSTYFICKKNKNKI